MSKAKITKKDGYRCAPQGHTVVDFPFGTEVTGQVAEWALADHAAKRLFDPRKEAKVVSVPETKSKPKSKAKTKKA